MLSDNPKTQSLPSPKRRPDTVVTNIRYSDAQKIEAVTTWLTLGDLTLTSNILKIPHTTLLSWKKTEWWQQLVKEVEARDNIVLSNKLKNIVDKSLSMMMDRLEKGDHIYDQKQGKLIRKPIGAKDLNAIASTMIEKKQKLQNTEAIQIAEENILTKLEKLAKNFEEVANKTLDNKAPINVTDVVFVTEERDEVPAEERNEDAVHEEREEGL